MWRGSTLESDITFDPAYFEETYGVPLQIYRGFWSKYRQDFEPEQREFIKDGGIVVYSIQPKPYYSEYADGTKDEEIRDFARAIKKVQPHKVMVFVGFEPDCYVPEGMRHTLRGTVEEYHQMYARFVELFKDEGVTNAVYGVDWAW